MDLNKAEKYVLGMMLASSNSGPIDNCDIHHLRLLVAAQGISGILAQVFGAIVSAQQRL